MKIKFISDVAMTSKGISFIKGEVYEIDEVEGKRLVDTFPTKFEAIITKVEPKVEPKPTTKSTKKD